jgi:hypothetical protein
MLQEADVWGPTTREKEVPLTHGEPEQERKRRRRRWAAFGPDGQTAEGARSTLKPANSFLFLFLFTQN